MHIENHVGKLFLVQSMAESLRLVAARKLYVNAPLGRHFSVRAERRHRLRNTHCHVDEMTTGRAGANPRVLQSRMGTILYKKEWALILLNSIRWTRLSVCKKKKKVVSMMWCRIYYFIFYRFFFFFGSRNQYIVYTEMCRGRGKGTCAPGASFKRAPKS